MRTEPAATEGGRLDIVGHFAVIVPAEQMIARARQAYRPPQPPANRDVQGGHARANFHGAGRSGR